jgi:CO/xanthine dehydrogenase Mo-binding subunit
VLHYGQHVAMVVAETTEQANAAAALIDVTYELDPPVLAYEDHRASRVSHPWTPDYDRGDVASALAAADVRINQTYTTAANTNNPIGLFATVAVWDGDALTVHDTTQYPHAVRELEVLFVGEPDLMTPLGTKGVGELAIVGMAAAVANAVYHATGTRIRSLPISIEKMLGLESFRRASVRR